MRKFGYWLEGAKRRPHQELSELAGAGWAGRLLKAFNFVEMPAVLLTIFCTGGIDFVGGYVYRSLLTNPLFESKTLGSAPCEFTDGEEIHEILFEQNQLRIPNGWREIISYF